MGVVLLQQPHFYTETHIDQRGLRARGHPRVQAGDDACIDDLQVLARARTGILAGQERQGVAVPVTVSSNADTAVAASPAAVRPSGIPRHRTRSERR